MLLPETSLFNNLNNKVERNLFLISVFFSNNANIDFPSTAYRLLSCFIDIPETSVSDIFSCCFSDHSCV